MFIHAISSAVNNYNMRSNVELQSIGNYLFAIQLLLMYGTPMFIFISEFIISFSYKDRLPQNFFKKNTIHFSSLYLYGDFLCRYYVLYE